MNWILLRGLARESRHWGDFPRALEAALPSARVHALDLPGNGALHDRSSPTRVEDMADAYRAMAAKHAIAGPLAILGLSLGGMAAMSWASRYPGEVSSLVLVNTSARPWCAAHERLGPGAALAVARVALASRTPERREAQVLRLVSANPDAHAILTDEWARYARERPVSLVNLARQLLAAARFRASLRPPVAAVLVLASRGDRLVQVHCSMRLASAWNASLAIHPAAGHDLPLDDPGWVAARIRDWQLDTQALSSAASTASSQAPPM